MHQGKKLEDEWKKLQADMDRLHDHLPHDDIELALGKVHQSYRPHIR